MVALVPEGIAAMHVTSGYYKTTLATFPTKPVRIDDPVQAAKPGVLGDRGANGLLFSSNESNTLHSTWDRCLAGMVSGATCSGALAFTPLAVKLKSLITPGAIADATTPGNHRDWPAAWATDTLRQAVAKQVYPSNLKAGRIKPDAHGDEDSVQAIIVAPVKSAYVTNHVATAQAQLVKAAIRLAALFNAIQWQ
jgi:S1/P1 Nuclease